MQIYKEALGEKHPDYADSLGHLAHLYQDQGLNAKAEALLVKALRIFKEASAERHSSYALCLNWLADIYHNQGLNSKAIPLLREALQFCLVAEAVDKRSLYTIIVTSLANACASEGMYDQAEAFYLDAIRVCKEALEENPRYAICVSNLARS